MAAVKEDKTMNSNGELVGAMTESQDFYDKRHLDISRSERLERSYSGRSEDEHPVL